MHEKARIRVPESMKEPGLPAHILFKGTGTNLKTGKAISFRVPDTITEKGLESIAKNVRFNNMYHEYLVGELQELF